jgi:hypothetical protein
MRKGETNRDWPNREKETDWRERERQREKVST